jgi:uncharacterized protein (UPF0548 family)
MNPIAKRGQTLRDGDALLQLMQATNPTYTDIGGTTQKQTPLGFHGATHQRLIGHGVEEFHRATDALRQWLAHERSGVQPFNRPPLTVGETVLLVLPLALAELRIACRIVDTIDTPKEFGFSYGTLPCHPEVGEEQFLITLLPNDQVMFTITVFWKPAIWLARLAGPIATLMQRRYTTRYLDALTSPTLSKS